MMDGNGGCCIARWTDGGHVSSGYDMTKMDMIMLKYRPIAPKPMATNGTLAATSDSGNSTAAAADGRQVKGAGRGRRKCVSKENNNGSNNTTTSRRCNNRRKRKSSSPTESDTAVGGRHEMDHGEQKGIVTLLPLFPEAPDLSPTEQTQKMPMWVNFDNSSPVFEDNYSHCHGGW